MPLEIAGGLVIGYPTERGFWVERVLPCRNVAAGADRERSFRIEPSVLINVRRTLAGTPLSVLGFYHREEATVTDCGELWMEPEMLWLRISPAGTRAWWKVHGRDARELEVELVPKVEWPVVACRE